MNADLIHSDEATWDEWARLAKNQYCEAMEGLRAYPPGGLVLRGHALPDPVPRPNPSLVEILLKVTIATTKDIFTVGQAVYRAEHCNGCWEARRYALLTNRTAIFLYGEVCPSERDAWMVCYFMYECDRRFSWLSDSCATIQESPTNCDRLIGKDFAEQEVARVNFESRRQPHLFALCLELGLDAVLEPGDLRLRIAIAKDQVLNTGKWEDSNLSEDLRPTLDKLVRRHQRRQAPKAQRRFKALDDLVSNWLTSGYAMLTKKDLTLLINDKHGTSFSVPVLKKLCQRLGLCSKRVKNENAFKYTGVDLEKRLLATNERMSARLKM